MICDDWVKIMWYECDRIYHNSIDKHRLHRRQVLKVSQYLNSSKSTIENQETIEIADNYTDDKENQPLIQEWYSDAYKKKNNPKVKLFINDHAYIGIHERA